MATPDIETYNKYYGNGETTEFSVSFPYSKREYVKVYVRRVGFEQVSVDPKDYEFVNDKTIRYPSNASGDDVLRDGDIITIQRETTVASEFIFSNQKRLFPEDVMDADDLAFEILQEQKREFGRAIVMDATSEVQPKVLLERVDLVYSRIDDIETVSKNIDIVDNVAKNIDAVSDVSAIKEEVKDVSDNMGAVLGVHANEENINVVKDNDASIRLVAGNIDAILDAPNQAESARVGAESARLSAENAASSAAVSNPPPLLTHSWEDHILNDIRYLRADTFSWQYGEMYKSAYKHLVEEWKDTDIPENWLTEVVGSNTITYYQAEDGHKIVLPDMEATVQAIYEETGVAWYYILDVANKRFKLPRELPITDKSKGNGKALGIWRTTPTTSTGTLQIGQGNNTVLSGNGIEVGNASPCGIETDPTKSGIISHRENGNGQQYLYFYVGNYTKSAIEQTAGVTTEVLNDKLDTDLGNATATTKETIVGWGMLSDTYIDLTLGESGTSYTAPANGWVILGKRLGSNTAQYISVFTDFFDFTTTIKGDTGNEMTAFCPVRKGDTFKVNYNATGTTTRFRFIYAVGEV